MTGRFARLQLHYPALTLLRWEQQLRMQFVLHNIARRHSLGLLRGLSKSAVLAAEICVPAVSGRLMCQVAAVPPCPYPIIGTEALLAVCPIFQYWWLQSECYCSVWLHFHTVNDEMRCQVPGMRGRVRLQGVLTTCLKGPLLCSFWPMHGHSSGPSCCTVLFQYQQSMIHAPSDCELMFCDKQSHLLQQQQLVPLYPSLCMNLICRADARSHENTSHYLENPLYMCSKV